MESAQKPKLLFVDDEPLQLEAYRRILLRHRRKEWEMTFETDPQKALCLIDNENFDVVVTDLSMPKMDGITFAGEVRLINEDLQIIMLTGKADLDTAVEVLNSKKIYKLFTKPCDAETLEDGINECLHITALKDLKRKENALGFGVLDQLCVGVIVCHPDGHIQHINRWAGEICDAKDGLMIDPSGNLKTTRAAMRDILASALSPEVSEDQAITIIREEQEHGLFLVVSSIEDHGHLQKLILISAPEKYNAPSVEMLQSMFAMPPSEAKLLHELVSGLPLKEAALELEITQETARTYLKRIFSRTQTGSQAELVRTVLMTPGLNS